MDNLAYIARPIDLGRASPDLVNYAIGELQAMGYSSYDPLGAFTVAGKPTGVVNRVNESAMLAATFGIAFLPRDVATVGVPAEVGYLTAHGKPVAVLSDHRTSWVVSGWRDGRSTAVYDLSEDGISAAVDWLNTELSRREVEGWYDPEPITFEKRADTATLPTRGYPTDAGYDLYASAEVIVPARGQAMVPVGVAVDIPDGMWAQITGRSSTLQKHNLMVAPTVGVIDEGYTGDLWAPVVSIADEDVKIEVGQRIAQLILHTAPGQEYTPRWGVTRNKPRGANGFGSTGR